VNAAVPFVVDVECHLDLVHRRLALAAPAQHHAQAVVAVGETVGLHREGLARDALDGEAPAVHRRNHRIDDGTQTAVAHLQGGLGAASPG